MKNIKSYPKYIFAIAALAWMSASACDQGGSGNQEPVDEDMLPEMQLTPSESVEISNGAISVFLKSNSSVVNAKWIVPSDSIAGLNIGAIGQSGFLMATTDRDGEQRASIGNGLIGPGSMPGYQLWPDSTLDSGVFALDESVSGFRVPNWPESLGAPTRPDGSPLLYGDEMAWGAFGPDVGSSLSTGLKNIRVGVSLFMFDRTEINTMIFTRYDVTNTGDEVIPSVLMGDMSDPDLVPRRVGFDSYCGLFHSDNQSAYDVDRNLVYTYNAPAAEDGSLADECYGFVVGTAFLPLSSNGFPEGVIASRIATRRSSVSYFPEFALVSLDSPEVAIAALNGLDINQNPMINPVTGEPTKFAFTGDPVAKTGWLDERRDVRQLVTKPAFSLEPGETRSALIVWIVANGRDLESALTSMKTQYDAVLQQRDLWDL